MTTKCFSIKLSNIQHSSHFTCCDWDKRLKYISYLSHILYKKSFFLFVSSSAQDINNIRMSEILSEYVKLSKPTGSEVTTIKLSTTTTTTTTHGKAKIQCVSPQLYQQIHRLRWNQYSQYSYSTVEYKKTKSERNEIDGENIRLSLCEKELICWCKMKTILFNS